MAKRYSKEQRVFLAAFVPGHSSDETLEAFTARWPDDGMTVGKIKAYKKNHRINSGTHYKTPLRYPQELLDFVMKEAPKRTNAELYELVCGKFGPDLITFAHLKAFKKNHKISSGLDGRFVEGQEPPNKGKTWDDFMPKDSQERCRINAYKKGHQPHNHRQIGSIVRTTDGYMARKIGEPDVWEYVHRATWEKYHGPVPDGMMVSFKDGDKTNCGIDNLMLISRAENALLNTRKLRFDRAEATEVGLAVAKMHVQIQKKRKTVKTTGGSYEGKTGQVKTKKENNGSITDQRRDVGEDPEARDEQEPKGAVQHLRGHRRRGV